jgi:hypothetical protein
LEGGCNHLKPELTLKTDSTGGENKKQKTINHSFDLI